MQVSKGVGYTDLSIFSFRKYKSDRLMIMVMFRRGEWMWDEVCRRGVYLNEDLVKLFELVKRNTGNQLF